MALTGDQANQYPQMFSGAIGLRLRFHAWAPKTGGPPDFSGNMPASSA